MSFRDRILTFFKLLIAILFDNFPIRVIRSKQLAANRVIIFYLT